MENYTSYVKSHISIKERYAIVKFSFFVFTGELGTKNFVYLIPDINLFEETSSNFYSNFWWFIYKYKDIQHRTVQYGGLESIDEIELKLRYSTGPVLVPVPASKLIIVLFKKTFIKVAMIISFKLIMSMSSLHLDHSYYGTFEYFNFVNKQR